MPKPASRPWLRRLFDKLKGEPANQQDFLAIVEEAEKNKLLKPDATAMIRGAIAVSKLCVEDVMLPRSQMIVLEQDKPLPDLLKIILDSGHSRFPVIGTSLDDVKGLLLAKDLLHSYMQHEHEPFHLDKVLRPMTTVPESKRLDSALKEFRVNHTHIALVVDEHGSISGLVTIEDIIEEIIGEIEDEYDIEENTPPQITKISERHYLINALTPIEDFNAYFQTQLSHTEFDTIGGLVTHTLGHVPKKNETCVLDHLQFKITQADQRRVLQLHLQLSAQAKPPSQRV